MTVLILSAVRDVHAQPVLAALMQKGVAAEVLDLSEFPTGLGLCMEYSGGQRQFRLRRRNGGELDLATVTAIWWRRPQPFTPDPTIVDPAARRFILSESETAFHGLYHSLNALWINRPDRDIVAGHKPFQLTLAQQIGFAIPPTLITNDPAKAEAFWQAHAGEVIHKQFVALPDTWRETRRLTEADRTRLSLVAHSPVLFQRYIRAVAEVRVIVIGDRLFAGRTETERAEYKQDIRMNREVRYTAYNVPDDVRRRILTLMERLELVYGAIDLLVTPEGEHIFLEINPAGQFLYIEQETGQPISAALADRLAAGAT